MQKMSENALQVYKKLYFAEGETDPKQVHFRVARAIAQVDVVTSIKEGPALPLFVETLPGKAEDTFKYLGDEDCQVARKQTAIYKDFLDSGWFRPNTPMLINLGRKAYPITSACFVGDVQDDLGSILDFTAEAGLVFKGGAGMGAQFGTLREKGSRLFGGGTSSGPISFMMPVHAVGEAVKSGGKRRAAMMGMLFDDHPDIEEFVDLKMQNPNPLPFMNLSVAISDVFMKAVEEDGPWPLCSPISGEIIKIIQAKGLFQKIANNAYACGDPGVWFIDRANQDNTIPDTRIVATNPCGEQGLLPYQSCCLGSINVSKAIRKDGKIDFASLTRVAEIATRFLDNAITLSGYPTPKYKEMAKNTRPIGVGIMGLADLLIELGVPYDSPEACKIAEEIQATVNQSVIRASIELAEERGPYPLWEYGEPKALPVIHRFLRSNRYRAPGLEEALATYGVRNSSWTTIAPTGSVSISADCSSGMEPLFGICWDKILADGSRMTFVHPIFEKRYKNEPWYQEAIEKIIENKGSCRGINCIPSLVRQVFQTAHDIGASARLEMQAALQRHVSNAISSTINLPAAATPHQIAEIYTQAWKHGLKGVTVYRDGCRDNQPVQFGKEKKSISGAEVVATPPAPKTTPSRPKIRDGQTYEVMTGHGRIYLTVNRDQDGKVLEVFTNGGKNGSASAANLEALARVTSIALQGGVSVEQIVKTIENINDGSVSWERLGPSDDRPVCITSIPDALAKVLKRFYQKPNEAPSQPQSDPQESPEIPCQPSPNLRCPDCGGQAYMKEGCLFCPGCGSKCG